MYGSKYLGTSIGGAGLGWLLGTQGFEVAVLAMCGLLGAIMLVLLSVRERPGERILLGDRASGRLVEAPGEVGERSANQSFLNLFLRLFRSFGHRNTLLAVVLALLVWLPNGMTYPVGLVLFMDQLGWEQVEYTTLTGTWGIGAALLGSVAGGFVADTIGPRRLATIAACAYTALFCVPGASPPRVAGGPDLRRCLPHRHRAGPGDPDRLALRDLHVGELEDRGRDPVHRLHGDAEPQLLGGTMLAGTIEGWGLDYWQGVPAGRRGPGAGAPGAAVLQPVTGVRARGA